MPTRDDLERIIRGWHAMEANRSDGVSIIDYDLSPSAGGVMPAHGRFAVLDQLVAVRDELPDGTVKDAAAAHAAFAGALLGEQSGLGDYVELTQGCSTAGWTKDYVEHVGDSARATLRTLGINWDAHSEVALRGLSADIEPDAAGDVIRHHAQSAEATVRELTGTVAQFELSIETTEVDAYWSYWLDGAGDRARLRTNTCRAAFNEADAYRFALHEVLGHALQFGSLSSVAAAGAVDWPRLMAVHGPHQVAFEGMAQMLPLAVGVEDERVIAQVRLDHYTQLVRSELHLKVNAGVSAGECRDHAVSRVPFWTDDQVAAFLFDRSRDPQLRSYLWAYPAGLDWFMNLYEVGGSLLAEVLHAAYQRPLVPRELEQLWPAGPRIGGNA